MSEIVKSLKEIVQAENSKALASEKSSSVMSRKARREQWSGSVETMDMTKIEKMNKVMTDFVSEKMLSRVEMTEPRELEKNEIDSIASEIKDIDEMMDFLKARRDQIRGYVFTSLDEKFSREGDADSDYPVEFIPGEYVSEENEVRLTREGGGRGTPSFDAKALKKALSPDQSAKVFKKVEKVVVEEEMDEEALLDMVNDGEIDLEVIRDAVVPGKHSSPRFQVRALKK